MRVEPVGMVSSMALYRIEKISKVSRVEREEMVNKRKEIENEIAKEKNTIVITKHHWAGRYIDMYI